MKAPSILDLIEVAAKSTEPPPVYPIHQNPKSIHRQPIDYLDGYTGYTGYTGKTGGGGGAPAPEGVEGESFAPQKDATDYPLLPQDQTGRSRFLAAATNLVNRISDAYGCDDLPGNERAELHRQATESIEAIRCFVLLARQAGLTIGRHSCWQEWGIEPEAFTLPDIDGSSQATPFTGNSSLAISDVGGRQTW